jgi:hypothetical protein
MGAKTRGRTVTNEESKLVVDNVKEMPVKCHHPRDDSSNEVPVSAEIKAAIAANK